MRIRKKAARDARRKKWTPLVIRGRLFTRVDINTIKRCVRRQFKDGRTRISITVCEELDWRQPNGWLKERACRDVLIRLERMGLIKLPPRRDQAIPTSQRKVVRSAAANPLDAYDLERPITSAPASLKFQMAKGDRTEKVWNRLVEKYHYLGHKIVVGRCIKYLVFGGEQLLAAISFSSPAWNLKPRDKVLEGLNIRESEVKDVVINNNRFLVLPNVQVPNLASRILSAAARRVQNDWESYYSLKPLVVETFVQHSLYSGVCYRAANWIQIGETRGYKKVGSSHKNSQEPKLIFLYGLNRRIRRHLGQLAVTDKKRD